MADERLANPGALGLGAFALTTFTLNIVNAELISKANMGIVLPLGLFYGGLAQFAAGMWDVKRGDIFGATCFTSYAAFWMALAVMIILKDNGVIDPIPREGMAVFLISWGLFSFYATVAAFKVNKAVFIVFVLLTILFFLLAIGQWNHDVHKIAGYEGILVAVLAWYCSAGILINNMYGRDVLPLGHVKPAK
jgi:uncharacterized protein